MSPYIFWTTETITLMNSFAIRFSVSTKKSQTIIVDAIFPSTRFNHFLCLYLSLSSDFLCIVGDNDRRIFLICFCPGKKRSWKKFMFPFLHINDTSGSSAARGRKIYILAVFGTEFSLTTSFREIWSWQHPYFP